MLVDTDNLPESKPDKPAAPHSQLRVRSDLHEEYSSDEIAKMTELYEGTLSNIEEGEIVKSKVLRVTDAAVILDVGFKSEGAVPIDEFKDPKSLKEGDEIEVFLEHLEDQEGAVVLSKKKADFMGCGSGSARPTRRTKRCRAPWSRRSRAAWWWT